MERVNRRSFVKLAGAATGAAALAAAPPLAQAAMHEGEPIDPTTGVPEEPLVAYVRDAERGEITITAGTSETTYRDRALVQRLLRAAGRSKGVR